MMKSLRTALRVKRMEQPSEKGYELARWLWVHQPSKNSAKEAFTMLSDIVAQPDAPADAFLALANIYRNGGCAVWDDLAPDTEQYIALRDKALAMGSELAETQYAKDRIFGTAAEEDPDAVIAMEDTMHECHSFKTLEDLCATYNARHELVGDLLILPRKDEEDGRYDPFV